MKKLIAFMLALAVFATALTACGDSSSSSSQGADSAAASSQGSSESTASEEGSSEGEQGGESSDLKAPVADGPIDITQGMTENMLTRSIHFEGDTTRLANVLKNAKDPDNDKAWNIVFLGDSITAGSTVSQGSLSYVNRFSLWWKDNVNRKTIFTNAGIGATNSYFGVHRVDKDVFEYTPDIIFIEFINDSGNVFYEATMESLIRKCLAYETNPAVILIEMSLEGGGNAQDIHSTSAEKYGVPVLSYHDAITPEIEAGNLTFKSSTSKPTAEATAKPTAEPTAGPTTAPPTTTPPENADE